MGQMTQPTVTSTEGQQLIPDLQITTTQHDIVHLFHCQERCLRNLVLNEGVSLVFVCQMVIAETDVLHRAERQKSLFDRVFSDIKVYAADVDPANKCAQQKLQLPQVSTTN